jgi:hypothetical protein
LKNLAFYLISDHFKIMSGNQALPPWKIPSHGKFNHGKLFPRKIALPPQEIFFQTNPL